jgi:hypothetical protein
MKYLYLLLLVPYFSHAGFSKAALIARLNAENAFNAPNNTWCFFGEPMALKNTVYMNCLDENGQFMGQWGEKGFKVLARAEQEQIFSTPVLSFNKITWYESSEFSLIKSFEFKDGLKTTDLGPLGPLADGSDSFLPYSATSFFFKSKGRSPQLWSWKNNKATSIFNPTASYLFTPQISAKGEIALKARFNELSEESPDRLYLFSGGKWNVILEDKNANPASPWLTFRHQMSVDNGKVLVVATDSKGEALILVENGKVQIIARTGVDLKSFDFFSPKMRAGTILVRGQDFKGNKVTFVKDENKFRSLLSQGDIVETDLGPGRVHYSNQDSIFYGAPGVDEKGNVILQATLTHPDQPRTLLGIGIIKFNKE